MGYLRRWLVLNTREDLDTITWSMWANEVDLMGTSSDITWPPFGDTYTNSSELFCLIASGSEDNVAEYYQQQVEMLEGFNEMDALAERGFIPGMSKVCNHWVPKCLRFQLFIFGSGLKTGNHLFWFQEEQEKLARSETFAIRISNIANMVLFAAKVYASVRSGSLAIIASTLDSLLDLLSGFILWFTAFSMQTPNPYQYPIGKKRMQPLVSHPPISLCDCQIYMRKFSHQ